MYEISCKVYCNSMKILGLNLGHDSSCTLLVNGKVIAACEEERYSKQKHTRSFPINAIKDCLKIGKLKIKDINKISVGFLPSKHINEFYIKQCLEDPRKISLLIDGLDRIKNNFNLEKDIRKNLNYFNKIDFLNHHNCHLASAFYPSGFKRSLILSIDGLGEFETGQIGIGYKKKIRVISSENNYPNSLGLIYAAITYYLGWKPFYDEGIVMGLAPLGNEKKKIPGSHLTYINLFRKIIVNTGKLSYKINKNWITYHYQRNTWLSKKFFDLMGKKRDYESKILDHHKNIAAALQKRVEEIVLRQLRYLKKKYKINNLCIAGGVGLNCSLNGKIHDSKIFEKIFVKAASGDAGISYGAALVSYFKGKNKPNFANSNFYLGSFFTNQQIKKELNKHKKRIKFNKTLNISKEAAELIYKNKILGWFQGAAEFGPRALGNRSILAKPYPAKMKNHINKNVKFREKFRPFAPAVMQEHAKSFFSIRQNSDHMLIAVKAKKKIVKKISATVHVDGSSRVQTVSEKSNKKFYNLIKEFNFKSGVPVVLNTSFNIKGQPIVNDPKDAIECFMKYNINYLAIGDYLVKKI